MKKLTIYNTITIVFLVPFFFLWTALSISLDTEEVWLGYPAWRLDAGSPEKLDAFKYGGPNWDYLLPLVGMCMVIKHIAKHAKT